VALGIERRNKFVSVKRRAAGKFPGAGEVQQDAIEINQFGRHVHGLEYLVRAINFGLAGAHHDDCQDDTRFIARPGLLIAVNALRRNVASAADRRCEGINVSA
jgi:hypothetical protein